MSPVIPNANEPTFDFVSYFEGHRKVSGWFTDRFGNVRRHFCGDFFGTVTDDGKLVLDEALFYSDGMQETRTWTVSVSDTGEFRAVSDSLVGEAKGLVSGASLNMQYVMKVQIDSKRSWQLTMDDFMFLQPDGRLHNFTHVKKFGIRIGTVSAQYHRPSDVVANEPSAAGCKLTENSNASLGKVAYL